MKIKYELKKKDKKARYGVLHTNHGSFEKYLSFMAKTWRRYCK